MSTENQTSSVSESATSSGSDGKTESNTQQTKDSVAYDTHRRLLDEKKKLQDKYEVLAKEKAERERKELEEKGEWQKLVAQEKQRADEAAGKLAEYEAARLEAKKAKALIQALDGGIDEKFYNFLPVDQILVDPETKEVNKTSVATAAENFRKTYPELLKKPGVKMPADAPKGNSAGTITREEWLKLPSKEMRKYKPEQIQ